MPSILWGGGESEATASLFKVPYHTFGTAKRRYLRLKPAASNDSDNHPWIEVALVDGQADSSAKKYYIVKAASPLSLVWDDPKSSATTTQGSSSLVSSPFKKRAREANEMFIEDIVQIIGGKNTAAFQAFIAKNGSCSVPHESCCFSLVSDKRSVDFYVQSAGRNIDGGDATLANAWRDSIQTLLDNFSKKQKSASQNGIGSISSSVRVTWDSIQAPLLFKAAANSDLATLRWFFDHGCPIDFMDKSTGDTVLIVACKLGQFDVARLALLGYDARNDPHPTFGQTALQTAVSAGHVSIVRLILATAEPSGADEIIVNHEDEQGEAPIHVVARCGSIEIMELLLSHGANLGLIDGRGRTCLHCSAQAGHASCLSFALDSGADEYIEVTSNDGFTPLHLAVRANKTECVEILLEAGANVSAETASGLNVYDLASKSRSERIMQLLLEYDVSEGESCSYDEDDESSLSGEDLFRGLNKYTVSPAKPAPLQLNYRSPYAGSLVSPAVKQHSNSRTLQPQWPQLNHSPIVSSTSSLTHRRLLPPLE